MGILSCNQSPVAESLSEADRLIIQFLDQGRIVKTVTTDQKAANKEMIFVLDKSEADKTDCTSDGKMIFYNKDNELQQVILILHQVAGILVSDSRYTSNYFTDK